MFSDIAADAIWKWLFFDFKHILWWGILFSMAVLLLLNKRNVSLPIVSGISALRFLYNTYSSWDHFLSYSFIYKIYHLCHILSAVALFVLLIISITKDVSAKRLVISLWFIPGLIFAVGCFPALWDYYKAYNSDGFSLGYTPSIYSVLIILEEIICFLAYIFTGLWLKAICREENETVPASPTNTFNESVPMLGGADKLLQYKELLDSGIITQEEFDEKKKQVLGQ